MPAVNRESDSTGLVYSPLCDTSERAYLAYCLGQIVRNGSGAIRNYEERVGVDCGADNCRRDDPVRDFNIFLRIAGGSGASPRIMGGDRPTIIGDGSGHCCSGPASVGGETGNSGVPNIPVSDAGRVLDRGHVVSENRDTVHNVGKVGSESGRSVSKGCLPGESTKERNQRWKAEKKEKKARRNLNRMSTEIGKGPKAVERMVVERRGYFSDCPSDVQQELRDTRAALLIAQNKRQLAIAERKQRMLTSNVTLVRDVLNVVKLQEQVEKVTKRRNDVRVGGWAQTVLSASSSEMVDRAASKPDSSIPTLSSISLGDCVDSSQREKRELQYKLALAEIEANIGEIGLQYEEEIEQARARVKEEYSDVAYPDELRFKREFIAAMARDMTLAERARLFTLAEDQGIDLDGLQY